MLEEKKKLVLSPAVKQIFLAMAERRKARLASQSEPLLDPQSKSQTEAPDK
jgi:hypothetical protein